MRCRTQWIRNTVVLSLASALWLSAGCTASSVNGSASAPSPMAQWPEDVSGQHPPTPRTQHALARVLLAQGRDAEAAYVLKQVLQREPAFMPAYVDLAQIYIQQDQLEEAMQTLTRGLEVRPGDPVLENNIGMIWFMQGDYERALAMFQRAADSAPGKPAYRANLAATLAVLGRDQEAKRLYQSLLPEGQVQHNLEVLRHAQRHEPDQARFRPASPPGTSPVASTPAPSVVLEE